MGDPVLRSLLLANLAEKGRYRRMRRRRGRVDRDKAGPIVFRIEPSQGAEPGHCTLMDIEAVARPATDVPAHAVTVGARPVTSRRLHEMRFPQVFARNDAGTVHLAVI